MQGLIDLSYKNCRDIAVSTHYDCDYAYKNKRTVRKIYIKKCIKTDKETQSILHPIIIPNLYINTDIIKLFNYNNKVTENSDELCKLAGTLIARALHSIDYGILVSEIDRCYYTYKYDFPDLYSLASTLYNMYPKIVNGYIKKYYSVAFNERKIIYNIPYHPKYI